MANNSEQETYIQVTFCISDVLEPVLLGVGKSQITYSSMSHREVFMDFDPLLVSKLSEKKIIAPGSPSSTLLSEQKLRGVIENARQILKVGPLHS